MTHSDWSNLVTHTAWVYNFSGELAHNVPLFLTIFCAMQNVVQVAYYICIIDQAWGQDGWILAKFFPWNLWVYQISCCLMLFPYFDITFVFSIFGMLVTFAFKCFDIFTSAVAVIDVAESWHNLLFWCIRITFYFWPRSFVAFATVFGVFGQPLSLTFGVTVRVSVILGVCSFEAPLALGLDKLRARRVNMRAMGVVMWAMRDNVSSQSIFLYSALAAFGGNGFGGWCGNGSKGL